MKPARLVLALFFSSTALAADIQVPAGQSIANAINHAAPGDRVLVRAGIHPGGAWIERSGTLVAPITILSSDGPRQGVIAGGTESLRIGNSSYLVFDGLEVRDSADNTIHIDSASHHVTLRNVYAHDAGHNGDVLKVNQCHHIVIERSEFARPGARDAGVENPYQECIDFVDVDDSAIRDCWIHDGGSMLLFVKGGSRDTVLERNVFSQQRAGASDPMVGLGGATDLNLLGGEQYEALGVVFRNNIITGATMGAIGVYDANGAYIANNLLLNNDRVLVEFRAGNGPAARSTAVRIANNLFVDTRGAMPIPYLRSSHGLTDFATTSNLFWNSGRPIPLSIGTLDAAGQPGHLVADPFVTAVAGDRASIVFNARPMAGSAARGTGINTSLAPYGVTDDIALVARMVPYDRGPYRLSGPLPPTPPPPPPAPVPIPTSCTLLVGQTRQASIDNPQIACAPHLSSIRLSADCCDWNVGRCYPPSAADRACGPGQPGPIPAPVPPPVPTPVPTPSPAPIPGPAVPPLSAATVAKVQSVLARGITAGNRLSVFAKVGDSITESASFLGDVGHGWYDLGAYAALLPTIQWFSGTVINGTNSFARQSASATAGWTTTDVLAGPLAAELQATRPAYAIIMLGTNDLDRMGVTEYRTNMQAIVDRCVTFGTVPILSTIPDRRDNSAKAALAIVFNDTIRSLATANSVPLIDYWSALQPLPNHGVSADGIHPNTYPGPDGSPSAGYFTAPALQYGYNVRSLTAVQMLDALRRM